METEFKMVDTVIKDHLHNDKQFNTSFIQGLVTARQRVNDKRILPQKYLKALNNQIKNKEIAITS